MPKLITTSWDDGHPKDFLISELLDKYNLKGTFYIPASNPENDVMNEYHVSLLAKQNEIGGHTLHHVRLTGVAKTTAEEEVVGCYKWLTDILGSEPVSFCFPLGAYNSEIVSIVKQAGFKVARTTELLSVSQGNLKGIIPTTIQVYEHSATTYFKHLAKRLKIDNALLWLRGTAPSDLLKMTDYYLEHILKYGGCFHLWGHSWELEKFQLWKKLEMIFQHISGISEFQYVPNRELPES